MTLPDQAAREAGRASLPFLIFLALMTSVIAMTIDAVLPALDGISDDLGFADPDDRKLIILAVFVGIGLGQPIFGPLSDAIGRRRSALAGWVLYCIGTLVAMFAPGLEAMLAGRLLQGIGAAGPRVVATAIVRDLYAGRPMARIISLIMTVFMLVPMFAPLIGQIIETLAGWRAIFGVYLALALVCATWHLARIPETLAPENTRPLSFWPLLAAFGEVLRNRTAMLYTFASTTIFGAFAAILSSAQQIFEEMLGLGDLFPLAFATLALCFAIAQFTNSRLVMTMGMRRLCRISGVVVTVTSLIALAIGLSPLGPVPPAWVFMAVMVPVFLGSAVMFANLTALALEPLGHIAGTASAAIMSISMLGAVPLGWLIARELDGTLVPLFFGYAVLGFASMVFIFAADRRPEEPGAPA
ncbi:MAG: multidrug effflux MFS transporter [Pseudomonadota bacterium]